MNEQINHPSHYGGEDNPYEAIKVIEAWDLNFHLGNAVKYISRFGKKQNAANDLAEDLKKARWYLNRAINNISVEEIKEAKLVNWLENRRDDLVNKINVTLHGESKAHLETKLNVINEILNYADRNV